MWSDKLLDAVRQRGYSADWPKKMKEAFDDLFGSDGGRYPANAKQTVTLRAPEIHTAGDDAAVPFAALIHPSNPNSGLYGGMSIAIFPGEDSPCLISFVVGTNGLAPDESILGRPGHARDRSRRSVRGSIKSMAEETFEHGRNRNRRELTNRYHGT